MEVSFDRDLRGIVTVKRSDPMRTRAPARVLEPTEENILAAAAHLRNGGVVGMPTETVYGLAGSAFKEEALSRIFNAKDRPTFDPLIVHVPSAPTTASEPGADPEHPAAMPAGHLGSLERLRLVDAQKLPLPARARAEALMQAFWPGPLTIVLPRHPDVPDLVTSGLPTVALRMPKHPVAQALIRAAGTPLAAPSANRFGRISPTSAQDVLAELGDRIDLILDGGACEVGLESTIVAIDGQGLLTLLRPGGIPKEAIERAAGCPVSVYSATPAGPAVLAPGMLASHYAPRAPLHLLSDPVSEVSGPDKTMVHLVSAGKRAIGLLLFSGDEAELRPIFEEIAGTPVVVRCLSPTGDLEEAGRNLFGALRFLDASGVGVIFAEPCPVDTGIGHAISDRLRRASIQGLSNH